VRGSSRSAKKTAMSPPTTTERAPVSTTTICEPRVWPGAGTSRSPGATRARRRRVRTARRADPSRVDEKPVTSCRTGAAAQPASAALGPMPPRPPRQNGPGEGRAHATERSYSARSGRAQKRCGHITASCARSASGGLAVSPALARATVSIWSEKSIRSTSCPSSVARIARLAVPQPKSAGRGGIEGSVRRLPLVSERRDRGGRGSAG
jgi:hypothetical protein